MKQIVFLWMALLATSVACLGQTPMSLQEIKDQLNKAGIRYKNLQMQTNGLCVLDLQKSGVTNLAVLKGLPVEYLNISGTDVRDLSPLAGLPLKALLAASTRITDLSPLKGMSLQYLDIKNTGVKSLAPLQGMPMQALFISGTVVTDLSPAKDMPLVTLIFTPKKTKDSIKILKSIPTLRRIGVAGDRDPLPAEEFWKKFGKGELK
jgi:Leucine-rich repeat (LRR) protein